MKSVLRGGERGMGMTKFTGGPWEVKPSPFEVYNMDHGALKYHLVQGDIMIAALYSDCDSPEANLIAAAPDMYAALEELRDLMEDVRTGDYFPDSATNQIADAALSKARGDSMSNEQECQHEDAEADLCAACAGSGEGMYDGSLCGTCNGQGLSKDVYCLNCGECVSDE